jgi:UDP-N-acetylmuramoyl-tripeptide--D-alanyl-D-alanine ligase
MKGFLLKNLRLILKFLAKLTVMKYQPFIVGVTGSVGKTSTKSAIATVLKSSFTVRMAGGNLNNELGVPLAILGDYQNSGGAFFWLGVILKSLLQLLFKVRYPKILVLEYAADRPGDIGYLLNIVKPNIAVVTAIGEIPVHVEFYESPSAVAEEKAKLVQGLAADGVAILNFDDPLVEAMKKYCRGKVLTYGFNEGANLRVSSFLNRSEFGKPLGIAFKLVTDDSFVPVRIDGLFGKAQVYAAAAAAAVGLVKNINLVKISEALQGFKGEPGRCRLIEGIKNSYILDDTYNSSPLAAEAALEILKDLSAPRKVAVLGDMAELGQYSTYAHEEVGRKVYGAAEVLVTVGAKARFIAEGARKAGFPKKNIYSFKDTAEAAAQLPKLLESRDLLLVKGSQSMRMEKIVLGIMAKPELAKELLVRQYGKWLDH